MNKATGLVVGGVVAILLASGCSTESPQAATPGTPAPPGTVFPSGFDTVPNRPPLLVELPEEVRDVAVSDIPVPLRINLGTLALSKEDGRCINTVIMDYLDGPGAAYAVDSNETIAALGGAVLLCAGKDVIAGRISATVRAANPDLSDQQTDCVREEVEVAEPAALALLLGAFTFKNGARVDLQQPFADSVARACGLPWANAG